MTKIILPERLAEVAAIPLSSGGHNPPPDGCPPGEFCVLEKWSYVTGLDWGADPDNMSPTIGAFLRAWNDGTDQAGRDRLDQWMLDNAERLIATVDDGGDELRGWLAADWLVRVCTPTWLELAGITESAAALRALPELREVTGLCVAQPLLSTARSEAAAAWDAARAAARAAGDGATYDERYALAREAADQKVEPTKVELQASAYELFERLVSPVAS